MYNGYGIGFVSPPLFSLPNFDCGKNVIIFGVDMGSSVHINNKKNDILILDKSPTQELDDTMLTAQTQYSINFSRSNGELCLSVPYKCKGSNSFLFVNTTNIYHFKANISEIKSYLLCLGKI